MSTILVGEILSVAMFLATIGAVLAGYPVAFTLAGVGLMFAGVTGWCGMANLLRMMPWNRRAGA